MARKSLAPRGNLSFVPGAGFEDLETFFKPSDCPGYIGLLGAVKKNRFSPFEIRAVLM